MIRFSEGAKRVKRSLIMGGLIERLSFRQNDIRDVCRLISLRAAVLISQLRILIFRFLQQDESFSIEYA